MRPRIGWLIPGTIALGLLLDAGTRLIPIDLFTFRAWEALTLGRGPTGPFEPNRVYVNPLTYGDLARPQRFSAVRQRHLEYFSTDAWGYRNTVGSSNGAVRWLLLGDSFGVGSGVSDGDTLASQLARWSGEHVYNASASSPLQLNDIRFTSDRVGMTSGLVIYEYMERQDLPAIGANLRMFTDGPPSAGRTLAERVQVLKKDVAISRMSILAGWGWDAIATKFHLTPDAANAPQDGELPTLRFNLADGATMLFFARDVEIVQDYRREIAADYLVWLGTELKKLNLELAVLIAPTKYHVYASSIAGSAALRPSDAPLERLAKALNARGVFAVNTTSVLERAAASDLIRHQYVYFLDDTHWNERGIEAAAKAFVDARRRAGRD